MKNIMLAIGLLLCATSARAGVSYLGTDLQDVAQHGVFTVTPGTGTWNTNMTQQGSVTVTPGTGTFNASVNGSTVTVVGVNGAPISISGAVSQSGSYTVTPGTGTFQANVNGSTVAIANIPNLSGKVLVYKSSDSMATSSVLTLTGLGKSIDLSALTGTCTFTISGGDPIAVYKNTSEAYDIAYTATNPYVTLTSKDVAATCKARIIGAN